jgi:hypothetical protein
MKISHIDLDRCLKQPRQWFRDQAAPKAGMSFGYDRALRNAIAVWHKTNLADEARRRLQDLISRHGFKNKSRVDEIEVCLDLYIKWCEVTKVKTADSMIRISLDLGGYLQLGGTVSRVDVTSRGYRGILLGAKQAGWKEQLRMPLLQKALSAKYIRPIESIEVGVQDLDGSSLQTKSYSSAELTAAEKEFLNLGGIVKALIP